MTCHRPQTRQEKLTTEEYISYLETVGLEVVASPRWLCNNKWKENRDDDCDSAVRGDDNNSTMVEQYQRDISGGKKPGKKRVRSLKLRNFLRKSPSQTDDDVRPVRPVRRRVVGTKVLVTERNVVVVNEVHVNGTIRRKKNTTEEKTREDDERIYVSKYVTIEPTSKLTREEGNSDDEEEFACLDTSNEYTTKELLDDMDTAFWNCDIDALTRMMDYDNIIDVMDYVITGNGWEYDCVTWNNNELVRMGITE